VCRHSELAVARGAEPAAFATVLRVLALAFRSDGCALPCGTHTNSGSCRAYVAPVGKAAAPLPVAGALRELELCWAQLWRLGP
jgi:hypothetical protein